MARTSQAKGREMARAVNPKVAKRAVGRNRAGQAPAAVDPDESRLPEAGPVATETPIAVAEPSAAAAELEPAAATTPESQPASEAAAASGHEVSVPGSSASGPGAAGPERGIEATGDSAAETALDDLGAPPAAGGPAGEAARADAQAPEPEPAAAAAPLAAAGGPPDLAAMLGAGRMLVEGTLRARSQMIGFGCRQAGHGLAAGRAVLTSASVPQALALQARYVGQAFDDALGQTLELSRLSADLIRAGLQSLRPR